MRSFNKIILIVSMILISSLNSGEAGSFFSRGDNANAKAKTKTTQSSWFSGYFSWLPFSTIRTWLYAPPSLQSSPIADLAKSEAPKEGFNFEDYALKADDYAKRQEKEAAERERAEKEERERAEKEEREQDEKKKKQDQKELNDQLNVREQYGKMKSSNTLNDQLTVREQYGKMKSSNTLNDQLTVRKQYGNNTPNTIFSVQKKSPSNETGATAIAKASSEVIETPPRVTQKFESPTKTSGEAKLGQEKTVENSPCVSRRLEFEGASEGKDTSNNLSPVKGGTYAQLASGETTAHSPPVKGVPFTDISNRTPNNLSPVKGGTYAQLASGETLNNSTLTRISSSGPSDSESPF